MTEWHPPPSHDRCVRACEEIRAASARLHNADDRRPGDELEAELLDVQYDYWDGWRRILEEQPP